MPAIHAGKKSFAETSHKVEIYPTKRGGTYDLPKGGKLVIPEGAVLGKKDHITCSLLTATKRHEVAPSLDNYQRLGSEVYILNTRNAIRTPVDIFLPCSAEADLKYATVVERAEDDSWLAVTPLMVNEPNSGITSLPGLWFSRTKLGHFVVLANPPFENFLLGPGGGLFNSKVNSLIFVRVPKLACPLSSLCTIQIIDLHEDRLKAIKPYYPVEMGDIVECSSLYDIQFPPVEFKRSITIRLPLPEWAAEEVHEALLARRTSDQQSAANEMTFVVMCRWRHAWEVVEAPLKFTANSVTFDTKHLGKFAIVRPRESRRIKLGQSIARFELCNSVHLGDILVFLLVEPRKWHLWVECVSTDTMFKTIDERQEKGFVLLQKIERAKIADEPEVDIRGRRLSRSKAKRKSLNTAVEDLPRRVQLVNGAVFEITLSGDFQIKASTKPQSQQQSSVVAANGTLESDVENNFGDLLGVGKPLLPEQPVPVSFKMQFHELLQTNCCCLEIEPVEGLENKVKDLLRRQRTQPKTEDVTVVIEERIKSQTPQTRTDKRVPDVTVVVDDGINSQTSDTCTGKLAGGSINGEASSIPTDLLTESVSELDRISNNSLTVTEYPSQDSAGMRSQLAPINVKMPQELQDNEGSLSAQVTVRRIHLGAVDSPQPPSQIPDLSNIYGRESIVPRVPDGDVADYRVIVDLEDVTEYLNVILEEDRLPTPTKELTEHASESANRSTTTANTLRRPSHSKESFDRLTAFKQSQRPKTIKEPKVVTGKSLQVLSKQVEQGLTLAVHLKLPDAVITGIGFDSLSTGQNMSDVTYKVLLYWKRNYPPRIRDRMASDLIDALTAMELASVAEVIREKEAANVELSAEHFGGAPQHKMRSAAHHRSGRR